MHHGQQRLLIIAALTSLFACGKGPDDTNDDDVPDDGPYAACEVDLTPDGLSPGQCHLTINSEWGSGATGVDEYWYSDGAIQEYVEDGGAIRETYTYNDQGQLHTTEYAGEGLYEGLVTYDYDAEGRVIEEVVDQDSDGLDLTRITYTYTVDGYVESVLEEEDVGDDGVVDSRILRETDLTLLRETTRYDQDNDSSYEFQYHDWYNRCGDTEVMEADVTGDGEIDATVFTVVDYNDQGLPIRVEDDNSEGEALDELWEHTYLPSGHRESSTFYTYEDGEWVPSGTHRFDWSDCDVDTVDPLTFRP